MNALPLDLANTCKSFRDHRALNKVNLRVHEGEWVGLLGPNGAGKTTLLSVIAGLLQADAGSLSIGGQHYDPCTRDRPHALVGLVPQHIALYTNLSAKENLNAFARFSGLEKNYRKDRVAWALAWTGLESRADDRVASFSGGMQRRLNIACAVLHDPRILLLDEPTVGVDPQARQRIWEMLRALRDEGTSLLHSSHQLDEVEQTCDRICVLDSGNFIADGTPSSLVAQMTHRVRSVTVVVSEERAPQHLPRGFSQEGARICGALSDIGKELELPELLKALADEGFEILDVQIAAQKLEDAFSELTGKELRE